jgi:hypothetical protein
VPDGLVREEEEEEEEEHIRNKFTSLHYNNFLLMCD